MDAEHDDDVEVDDDDETTGILTRERSKGSINPLSHSGRKKALDIKKLTQVFQKNQFSHEEDREQPIERREDGSTLFRVKMKLLLSGKILDRIIKIDTNGIAILDVDDEKVVDSFEYKQIRHFYYHEDHCFVMIRHTKYSKEPQNVAWKTTRQATEMQQVIESCIKENLRKMNKLPQEVKQSETLEKPPGKESKTKEAKSGKKLTNIFKKKDSKTDKTRDIQPIHKDHDGSILFPVQMKVFEKDNSKGTIVERWLHISKDGMAVLDVNQNQLEKFLYREIHHFYYHEDNCFVSIKHKKYKQEETVTWKSYNQASNIETIVNGFIQENLKERQSKAKGAEYVMPMPV